MANFGELDKLTVHNNILDRLTALERAFRRFQRVDVRVDEISEFSDELGEMVSGADVEGEELADASWFAMDMADVAYTTPRMPVEEGDLVEMTCTVGYGSVTSGGGYAKVQWYDDPAAGSLIAEDRFRTFSYVLNKDSLYGGTFRAPAGAQSFCIDAFVDRPSGVQSQYQTYIYKFHARVMNYAMRLALREVAMLDVDNSKLRLTAGARQFPAPGPEKMIDVVLVTTSSGNLTNGFTQYAITWVDSYGETTPAFSTDAVTIDATHKQAIVYRPPVPSGITSWRLYRKSEDTDEYQLVATIPSATTSYTDNIASANLGDAPPEENTTLGRPVLPTAARQMGNSMRWKSALDWNAASGQIHGEYWRTPDAIGEWCAPDPVLLEPGRYQMTLMGVRSASGGPVSVFMDGQLIGQINQYNSTTSYNHQPTLDFVVEEPGWHEFLFVTDGTSSSRLYVTEYWVRRVGR